MWEPDPVVFTFHYVSILMLTAWVLSFVSMSFTFHYVSILISPIAYKKIAAIFFTFHYVSILIRIDHEIMMDLCLYIPLCLYFNCFLPTALLSCTSFTFHYVSILMQAVLAH